MMLVRSITVTAALAAVLAVGCRKADENPTATRTTAAEPAATTPAAADTMGMQNGTMGQLTTPVGSATLGAASALASTDMDFLKKAASGNLSEIGAARHVKEAGMSPEAKALAATLYDDHTKSEEQLQALAKKKGVTLPAQVAGDNMDMMKDLTKLAGKDLDKKYAKEMVSDHEADIKEMKEAAKSVKDEDIRAWAQQQVPILEGHLAKTKALDKKLN